MKFSSFLISNALTFACLRSDTTTVNAQSNACDGLSYCIKLDEDATVGASLGGGGTDISLTYDASSDADTELSYVVSVMTVVTDDTDGGTKCGRVLTLADATAAGITPLSATYGTYTESWDQLQVGFDIVTSAIEDGELSTSTSDTTFTVSFCAKVDLMYNDADIQNEALATSKTILSLTVDKSKDFSFDINAAAEATGSETSVVTVDYGVTGCVCEASTKVCLAAGYAPFRPGDQFGYCVTTSGGVDDDAQVVGLKNLKFTNTNANANGLQVPIVNAAGKGVGPASDPTCNDANMGGGCSGTAITFAKMYEIEIDGVLTPIQDGVQVSGVAVLGFKTGRRRLGGGSSLVGGGVNEEEETKLVEVGFDSGSGNRDLQQEDGAPAPANDFNMDMDMATPPDRTSAGAALSSPSTPLVSMMVAGLFFLLLA